MLSAGKLAGALALWIAVAGCGPGWLNRSTSVAGRDFAYRTAGSGSPTVVIDAGAGGVHEDQWRAVIDGVSRSSEVFIYNRAGYRGSELVGCRRRGSQDDDAACKRTAREAVLDLRKLLEAAGIGPPYVLVGHSLGGWHMQLFARAHPEDCAALVLVDSPHEDMSRRRAEAGFGEQVCWPKPSRSEWALFPRGVRAELRGLSTTEQQLRDAPPLGDVPLVVLTGLADKRDVFGEDVSSLWLETQRLLASHSTKGDHVVLEQAGHNIPGEQPAAVVEGIRAAVHRARRGL